MRLGMSGCFLPADMNDLTPAMCQRVRELGFSGIFTRFRANDPHTTPQAQAQRVRDLLSGEGVRLFQATGYWQNMITPDEMVRKESVRTVQAALRLAGWLGARGIDTGPGSMNPDGPWFPHPDNWTPSARRQLVKTLKECAPAAEDAGVYLSLEAHQLVTLQTSEITKEVLDEVDSPWVRCDYPGYENPDHRYSPRSPGKRAKRVHPGIDAARAGCVEPKAKRTILFSLAICARLSSSRNSPGAT